MNVKQSCLSPVRDIKLDNSKKGRPTKPYRLDFQPGWIMCTLHRRLLAIMDYLLKQNSPSLSPVKRDFAAISAQHPLRESVFIFSCPMVLECLLVKDLVLQWGPHFVPYKSGGPPVFWTLGSLLPSTYEQQNLSDCPAGLCCNCGELKGRLNQGT